jgi:hypothetical protein
VKQKYTSVTNTSKTAIHDLFWILVFYSSWVKKYTCKIYPDLLKDVQSKSIFTDGTDKDALTLYNFIYTHEMDLCIQSSLQKCMDFMGILNPRDILYTERNLDPLLILFRNLSLRGEQKFIKDEESAVNSVFIFVQYYLDQNFTGLFVRFKEMGADYFFTDGTVTHDVFWILVFYLSFVNKNV